jgi:hypothetical protein
MADFPEYLTSKSLLQTVQKAKVSPILLLTIPFLLLDDESWKRFTGLGGAIARTILQ